MKLLWLTPLEWYEVLEGPFTPKYKMDALDYLGLIYFDTDWCVVTNQLDQSTIDYVYYKYGQDKRHGALTMDPN